MSEFTTGKARKRSGQLTDYEMAWVVRAVVKLTDKSLREIGEALANELADNDSFSDYEQTLGNVIAMDFERLWPREGLWEPGPDARQALLLIQRVL